VTTGAGLFGIKWQMAIRSEADERRALEALAEKRRTLETCPPLPLVVHRAGDPLDLGVVELDDGWPIVRWAKDGAIDSVTARGGTMYAEAHGWRLDPVTRRAAYVRAVRAAADAAYAREFGETWAPTK
jgi:hypothetical protein